MAADKKTDWRKYTSLTQSWSENKTNGPDCHHALLQTLRQQKKVQRLSGWSFLIAEYWWVINFSNPIN